ncbi:anthranilate synthase family protein [Embleya hyalina]|uniref:anthranilate synthase n=1 Tax=Embleya hyalina TaxID=516124 RepID=A0A401YNQ9_9ACTN|nr:anthranilate synthase family protein [Embleya hyalina]GCD96253.1 phenazine-specific anthranilate synthase component I [Embleya hyalina]
MRTADALSPLFSAAPPPFALIRREHSPVVELLTGEIVDAPGLDALPLPAAGDGPGHELLALVPYGQIRERGFEYREDGTPLRCLRVTEQHELPLAEVLAALPQVPVALRGGGFDVDDESYAVIVKRVIEEEIGRGEGANFVIRRDYRDHIEDYTPASAGTLLHRLLTRESGAYWTYLIHTGELTLVGASPERHVSSIGGEVVMNPISGTYRHPAEGPSREGLLAFLRDPKEIDELFMVVDEELKMMSEVCDLGGAVEGPFLKPMGHLTHTEYLLRGVTSQDVGTVLRGTMFAPTVTGSPLENACRVIRRHEPTGRGYYSGVLALIGRDGEGRRTLDAPILIRTAYITPDGGLRVPAGATLVRHSTPEHEVAETHAKAAGVLAALGVVPAAGAAGNTTLAADPDVLAVLAERNAALAPFWLRPRDGHALRAPELAGRHVLVVDGEDTFTAMLAHVLRTLGLRVEVRSHDDVTSRRVRTADLVVLGPGPGDPRDTAHRKIRLMGALLRTRLDAGGPLLAVCLGHQLLSHELGLELIREERPYQGKQETIDLFGRPERVGFYNAFTALRPTAGVPNVEFAADPFSGRVHALRSSRMRLAGVQFHPESVLTHNGLAIVRELLAGL